MIVIPAIDVRGAKVVRLVRGHSETETTYAEDPAEVAAPFVSEGASRLHVVDLDAAFGTGNNETSIRRTIEAAEVPVQVGGGLRSIDAVEAMLQAGAARVVLGTEAIRDPEFLTEAVQRFDDRVVVAVDTDGRAVRVRGWTEEAGPLDHVLPFLDAAGAPRFLVTVTERDGTLEGPDLRVYERVLALTSRPVLASGGVRSVEDLRALAQRGVEGAVVGTALYEGALSLTEALAVVR